MYMNIFESGPHMVVYLNKPLFSALISMAIWLPVAITIILWACVRGVRAVSDYIRLESGKTVQAQKSQEGEGEFAYTMKFVVKEGEFYEERPFVYREHRPVPESELERRAKSVWKAAFLARNQIHEQNVGTVHDIRLARRVA